MENLLAHNIYWMAFNADLALLAISFGILMDVAKRKWAKWLFFFLWVIFVPNTLYILTDLYHLPEQWGKVSGIHSVYLIIQYLLLIPFGLISFIFAMEPFEKLLKSLPHGFLKWNARYIIFFSNFIIAFGIVIGRVQRTNSWEVFTKTISVIHDSIRTVSSLDLVIVVLIVGIIANCIYFGLKNFVATYSYLLYQKVTSHLFSSI